MEHEARLSSEVDFADATLALPFAPPMDQTANDEVIRILAKEIGILQDEVKAMKTELEVARLKVIPELDSHSLFFHDRPTQKSFADFGSE